MCTARGVILGSVWGRFGVIQGSFWGHFGVLVGPGASPGCPWAPRGALGRFLEVLGGPLGVLGHPWASPGGSLGHPGGVRERCFFLLWRLGGALGRPLGVQGGGPGALLELVVFLWFYKHYGACGACRGPPGVSFVVRGCPQCAHRRENTPLQDVAEREQGAATDGGAKKGGGNAAARVLHMPLIFWDPLFR